MIDRRDSKYFKKCFIYIIIICIFACEDQTQIQPSTSMMTPSLGEFSCAPSQSNPYPQGIPYVGIHGNAGNSDFIDCTTAGNWSRSWHALRGLGMTQPNTFSPDGSVTYVTTTNIEPDGCRLFAVDVDSGQFR